MEFKKIQITFNLDNKMQSELYKKCIEEFGENLSGGIKIILSLYFNGGLSKKETENIPQIMPQQNKIDNSVFSSVL